MKYLKGLLVIAAIGLASCSSGDYSNASLTPDQIKRQVISQVATEHNMRLEDVVKFDATVEAVSGDPKSFRVVGSFVVESSKPSTVYEVADQIVANNICALDPNSCGATKIRHTVDFEAHATIYEKLDGTPSLHISAQATVDTPARGTAGTLIRADEDVPNQPIPTTTADADEKTFNISEQNQQQQLAEQEQKQREEVEQQRLDELHRVKALKDEQIRSLQRRQDREESELGQKHQQEIQELQAQQDKQQQNALQQVKEEQQELKVSYRDLELRQDQQRQQARYAGPQVQQSLQKQQQQELHQLEVRGQRLYLYQEPLRQKQQQQRDQLGSLQLQEQRHLEQQQHQQMVALQKQLQETASTTASTPWVLNGDTSDTTTAQVSAPPLTSSVTVRPLVVRTLNGDTKIDNRASDSPSFDCKKARSATDTAICNDSELSQLDAKMASLYRRVMEQAPPSHAQTLKESQRQWLRERAQLCDGDRACIKQQFDQRIEVLSDD